MAGKPDKPPLAPVEPCGAGVVRLAESSAARGGRRCTPVATHQGRWQDVAARPYLEPLPRSNRSPARTALLASAVRGAANPRSRWQKSEWRVRSPCTTPPSLDGDAL